MKVVPEDVFTVPLEGAGMSLQSTAGKYTRIDDIGKLLFYDLPVQASTGSHILFAMQVAVAVVTAVEIQYPVLQV